MPPRQAETGARHAAHLRGLNLDRVLAIAMERPGPFTRAELIQATGLSAPTVGSLTTDLIRAGLVSDLGTGPSSGGRRPSFMAFNARHRVVAGIDIGPTRTRLALADLVGERIGHRVIPTPTGPEPKAMLVRLAAVVRELLKEAGLGSERLLAVGAGAPGVVDHRRGMVMALAPNLEGWSEVPMASILKRTLSVPVVVENDVNLAILGERWKGAARGHDTCAFITLGTGIGAGVVVNGALHHGHHFLAGEIALMCMGPQFVETDFGSRGCLETLAGLKALSAQWSPPAGHETNGWVRELFAAAAAGNRRARRTVQDAATLIGIATANLSVVLDPSLIVLGGALVAQGPSLVDDVRAIVGRIVPTPSRIAVSELGEEAPLWGCLLLAMNEAREQLREQLRGERASA
jgi:predicted NBD/HSP70 family sugar kinase